MPTRDRGQTSSAMSEGGHRARELEATWQARIDVRTWERLCPHDVAAREPLAGMSRVLEEPEALAELRDAEATGAYPHATLARLRAAGLADLLTDEAGATMNVVSLAAMNAVAARASGSLAITLGVNALALLPFTVAASEELRAEAYAKVRAGGFASFLLTELPHGSNLVAIETRATPNRDDAGTIVSWVVRGEKDMINGAREHALLVTLARTRQRAEPAASPLEARGDFSLFWIDRGPGVVPLDRWTTLPGPAADISGVRFEDAVVPASRVVGAEGDGFGVVQKTLIVSRGAIGALASGSTSAALGYALGYAEARSLYGKPILALAPVREHLVDMLALDLAVAAVSVKAALAVNAWGLGAAHVTAVAKYACCRLAEEAVTEGRRLVASRALVTELPYARIARDVLLYGVFDGTSHVMLSQIAWRVFQLAAARTSTAAEDPVEVMRALYTRPIRSLTDAVRAPTRVRPQPLEAYLARLAEVTPHAASLGRIASALLDVAAEARRREAWGEASAESVRAADALAMLEAAVAVVELADPAARALLGMPPGAGADTPLHGAVLRLTVIELQVRVVRAVRALAAPMATDRAATLPSIEEDLLRDHAASRHEVGEALRSRCDARPGAPFTV